VQEVAHLDRDPDVTYFGQDTLHALAAIRHAIHSSEPLLQPDGREIPTLRVQCGLHKLDLLGWIAAAMTHDLCPSAIGAR
jgi:hypothetical protein